MADLHVIFSFLELMCLQFLLYLWTGLFELFVSQSNSFISTMSSEPSGSQQKSNAGGKPSSEAHGRAAFNSESNTLAETLVAEIQTQSFVLKDKFEIHQSLEQAWKEKKLEASMFKVTLLPRQNGVRVWFNVDKELQKKQAEDVMNFLDMHFKRLLKGKKMKGLLLPPEKVALLRLQDDQFRNHVQSSEQQLEQDGLEVANNLSKLLMKRRYQEGARTQRRVSKLVDLVARVNAVAERRKKKADRDDSEADDEEFDGIP